MDRNKLAINWCRISAINSIILMKGLETSPTKAMMFHGLWDADGNGLAAFLKTHANRTQKQ